MLVGGVIAGIIVGFLFGFFLSNDDGVTTGAGEWRLGSSSFTNPLLECDLGEETLSSQKIDFTSDLTHFVDDLKDTMNIEDISVYYRDLNNGPAFGINQEDSFAPASLLKIPLLISYLRWAEDDPEVLEERILFDKPVDVGYQQEFAPSVPLVPGTTYTTRELLEHMIKYSDNQALLLLFNRIPQQYQEELYALLGVDASLITDPLARLTVKHYSIFFRILFNASFLSRTHSEYALQLLSETSFVDGLRASVPESIPIAHKFGERKTRNDLQQFHDCGIVYYPNHPYLLCVMTRGNEVTTLIDAIRETSRFVYDEIDAQYAE